MKQTFGSKLNGQIAHTYTLLYQSVGDIEVLAQDISHKEYSGNIEFEKMMDELVKIYDDYKSQKKAIEILEDIKEGV